MSQEKLVTFQVVTNAENKPSIIGAEKWEILGTKALIKDCQLDSPDWDINRLFDHLYNNLCKLIMEQVHKGNWELSNFRSLINTIRTKWDSVNNKIPGMGLTEQLWNAFYASRVCLIGNTLFPEVYAEVKAYEPKKKESITVTRETEVNSKKWKSQDEDYNNSQKLPKPKGKVVGKLKVRK